MTRHHPMFLCGLLALIIPQAHADSGDTGDTSDTGLSFGLDTSDPGVGVGSTLVQDTSGMGSADTSSFDTGSPDTSGGFGSPGASPSPIPCEPGAPKLWEDFDMWSPYDEVAVAPCGNIQNRVPLFAWDPPGVGLPIEVTLVHDAVLGDVNEGWGYGWRLAAAATLTVLPSGDVRVVEPIQGIRDFDELWGSYRAEPFDPGRLARVGSTYELDEKNGIVRTFADPNGLGYVEVARTDRVGDTVTLSYDVANRLTAITDSAGRSAIFTHSGMHFTAITDPTGSTFIPVYQDGNLVEVQGPPIGGTLPTVFLSYEVQSGRHLVSLRTTWSGGVDQSSPILTMGYLDDGRFHSITYPDSSTVQIDTVGDRVMLSDSLGITRAIIYKDGAVSEAILPDGRRVSIARDSQKRPVQVIDEDGRVLSLSYDADHNLTSTVDPTGTVTTYTHDARGNVTSTTRNGLSSSATYNAFDQATAVTNHIGESWLYSYDGSGNLVGITDFSGVVRLTAAYDGNGRPTSNSGADGRTYTITWTPEGHWTSITDPDGLSIARVVDAFGRVQSITSVLGETTTFSYDALGRPIQTTAGDGGKVSIDLDLDNRVTSVVDSIGPITASASATYTATHTLATQDINGVTVRTAAPTLGWMPEPPGPGVCEAECGNRCGVDISDTCGGVMSCACDASATCSSTGYCVLP